jgi:hypothetical protein
VAPSKQHSFCGDKMPYYRLAARAAEQLFFDLTVRLRKTLMLTQVFRPGIQ